MIRCAAIIYMCDQNEPSSPFVLDLPDEPSKADVERILAETLRGASGDEEGNEEQEEVRVSAGSWGDVQAEGESGLYLIVGFPPEHQNQLRGLFGLAPV